MKKILCILSLALFAFGGSLFAQKGGFVNPAQGGKGGFHQGGEIKVSSVAEAKALPDDAVVVLRGYIVEQLGDEKYRFKDEVTGETIVVEIDDDDWKGQVVGTEDLIMIYGEMDKGLISTEVDAKRVHKLPAGGKGALRGAPRGDKPAAAGCTDCGCAAPQKK